MEFTIKTLELMGLTRKIDVYLQLDRTTIKAGLMHRMILKNRVYRFGCHSYGKGYS